MISGPQFFVIKNPVLLPDRLIGMVDHVRACCSLEETTVVPAGLLEHATEVVQHVQQFLLTNTNAWNG